MRLDEGGAHGRPARQRAAAGTGQDSGRWVQLCIDHARQNRYSVVIEGTMRDPQVPLRTAAAFRDTGYRVEAWVMAAEHDHQQLLDQLAAAARARGTDYDA